MKRLFFILAMLSITSFAFGVDDVSATKHNLSSTGTGTLKYATTTEVCVFCHTPHGAASGTAQLIPLWNHTTTSSTFATYTSPTGTLDGTITAPAGVTLACLTCHDGTISLGAVLNFPGTVTAFTSVVIPTTSAAYLGIDLANDHPVSITYNTADTGLNNPPTAPAQLFTNKVECASCHNVHDNTNTPFLVNSNDNSDLCLLCHIK